MFPRDYAKQNFVHRFEQKEEEIIYKDAMLWLEISKTIALWLIFITLYWHWF